MTLRTRKTLDGRSGNSKIVDGGSTCQVVMIISPEIIVIDKMLDLVIIVVSHLFCYLI